MRPSRWSCFVMMVALAGPAGCVLDEAEEEVGIGEDIELDELSGDLSTGTTYTLAGVQSGRCIDVPGRSTADDVALTLWDCNGGTNQQFRFEAADGGHYRIRNHARRGPEPEVVRPRGARAPLSSPTGGLYALSFRLLCVRIE
ncbi:RICIN domain-containing protein [Sorangium sp. So ce1099]|uniref:RICIN domain-containing protein n=1 Tax=Sorangium sp. So ce1099 TaxID=3133331 RepID=UPI003F5E270B